MTGQDWWVRDAGSWRSVLGTTVPLEPVLPPDPDDPYDPVLLSWLDAWATQNYNTILGWYNANTGLLNPSALQPVTSSKIVTTANGQTIENRNIVFPDPGFENPTDVIEIRHNNVTVRNCKVYAGGPANAIRVMSGVSGAVVEHCEFDGSTILYGTDRSDANFADHAVTTRSNGVTVRFNLCYNWRQAIELNPFGVAEYNRVRDIFTNAPGVSTSSIRTQSYTTDYHGGTTVRRNLVEAGGSAALTAYASGKPVRDCEWHQNLIVGVGVGFGIRGGQVENDPNRFDNRDIRINDNRFRGEFAYPNALGEGTNAGVRIDQPGSTFDRNRWLGSSVDLPARCGVTQDACHL